ncbi:MAG TPA: hypothetical protein VLV83_16220 [Acidobacteriota bacterium]|nr:hypothetical protein [Acidobacteriota bacterium]
MISLRLPRTLWPLVVLGMFAGCGSAGASQSDQRPSVEYSLKLRFDADNSELTGEATVLPREEDLTQGRARFAVSGSAGRALDIRSVAVEGTSGEASWSPPDGSGIVSVEMPEGRSRITLNYRLNADPSTFQPFGYYIFEGISGWAYPRLLGEDGSQPPFADFEVQLDSPTGFAVLTTGGSGEGSRQGDRVHREYQAEHVPNFAIVLGDGYRVVRREDAEAPIVAFFHPDYEERFRLVVRRAEEAARWYRKTYGFFPLEEIGIIQGNPKWGGGYPLPNMFAVHLAFLDDKFITWITAHEIGHYYWGGTVLGASGGLDWLQLALGIWSDQLYLSERRKISLQEQWRSNEQQGDFFADYLSTMLMNREQELGLSPAEFSRLDFDYNSWVRHGKAATGLYLLSLRLGPERFLDVQRQLLSKYRYRNLSIPQFVSELRDSGLPEAEAFLNHWQAGDASIGMAVSSVQPADQGDAWVIELDRTGTVPYPVEVVVETESETVRRTISAVTQPETIRVDSRPINIRLDPDGEIPMWNSDHPGIRAAYLRAMERAQIDSLFVPLTLRYLENRPEDAYLRYRLARRLYLLGRWDQAASLWTADRRGCESREACLAAVYAARANIRAGRFDVAQTLLSHLESGALEHEAHSALETARKELSQELARKQ